jgi:hypothetical protein
MQQMTPESFTFSFGVILFLKESRIHSMFMPCLSVSCEVRTKMMMILWEDPFNIFTDSTVALVSNKEVLSVKKNEKESLLASFAKT